MSKRYENVIVKENFVSVPPFHEEGYSFCEKCGGNIDWESHNSGSLQCQYWIGYCDCYDKYTDDKKAWKMTIETVKFQNMFE